MSNEIQSMNSSSVDIENEVNHDLCSLSIKRKFRALKKLEFERQKLEKEFFREVFNLEMKFDERLEPINEKRRAIISGEYEPTQADCGFAMDDEEDLCEEFIEKLSVGKNKPLNHTKGIPGFWLLVLKADEENCDLIESKDEPALQYLNDIKVIRSEDPMKLKIVFCFDSNEFFSNEELTIEYDLSVITVPNGLWSHSLCACVDRKGCQIDWKEGKDLTKKSINIKSKTDGNEESVVESVKAKSFFNFFDNEITHQLEEEWLVTKTVFVSLILKYGAHLMGVMNGSESSDGSSDSSSSSSESSGESSCDSKDE